MARGDILAVSSRHYPAQASILGHVSDDPILREVDQTETPPPTLCVLVAGEIGDYAAYIGHGTKQWVAAHGDKVTFNEACCHFPGGQLKKELYRL